MLKSTAQNASTFCYCEKSAEITLYDDFVYGPTKALTSPKIQQLKITDSAVFFEKEHSTAWYKIPIKYDGSLSFTIIPIKQTDDYDFILFKCSQMQSCDDIKQGKIKPTISNIAHNDSLTNGVTGTNDKAKNYFERKGPNPPYCKEVKVKRGEVVYLVLDNVYKGGLGHTLKFNLRAAPERYVYDSETNKQIITPIKFVNKSHQVTGKLNIECIPFENFFRDQTPTSGKFEYLLFEQKGYVPTYRSVEEMIGEKRDDVLYIDKLIKGNTYSFKGFYFKDDFTLDEKKSDIALKVYSDFLKKNILLTIEFQSIMSAYVSTEDEYKKAIDNLITVFVSKYGIVRSKMKINYDSSLKEKGNCVILKLK